MKYFILMISFSIYAQCTELSQLNKAYNESSKTKYIEFLNYWSKKYSPITEQDIKNKIIMEKYSYELVNLFYNDIILRLKFKIHSKNNYFLIKNEIDIAITGDIDSYFSQNTQTNLNDDKGIITLLKICNFRPKINNNRLLYLDGEYRSIIKRFLNYDIFSEESINLQNETIKNKIDFLNIVLNIYPSHLKNQWKIETEPVITGITFNSNFKKAIIHYEFEDSKGKVFFIRGWSKWKFKKRQVYEKY